MNTEKQLSKAQQEVVNYLQNGSRLFFTEDTWIKKNAFYLHPDGKYTRSNIKVLRKLLEFGKIKVAQQHGFLTVEYALNGK